MTHELYHSCKKILSRHRELLENHSQRGDKFYIVSAAKMVGYLDHLEHMLLCDMLNEKGIESATKLLKSLERSN